MTDPNATDHTNSNDGPDETDESNNLTEATSDSATATPGAVYNTQIPDGDNGPKGADGDNSSQSGESA